MLDIRPSGTLNVPSFAARAGSASQADMEVVEAKLATIEEGADVTDAGNVGSSIHGSTAKTSLVDNDEVAIIDSAASNVLKRILWSNVKTAIGTSLGAIIVALTGKGTPVDADSFAIQDSEAAGASKELTLNNLGAYLFTGWGARIVAAAGKTTPVNADSFAIQDSEASAATKELSLNNLGAYIFSGIGSRITGATNKSSLVDADSFLIADSAASDAPKRVLFEAIKNLAVQELGPHLPELTNKATPVDADLLPLSDSAASDTLKRLTVGNLKAMFFTGWGALVAAATSKATPVDADDLLLADSAASEATKRLSWANAKATLKTYFDTLYSTISDVNAVIADVAAIDTRVDAAEVVTSEFNASGNFNYRVADVAEGAQVVGGVHIDGTEVVSWDVQLAARDAQNKAYAERVRAKRITGFAVPDADYNAIIEEGQSLADGAEGHPALSTTNVDDNKMWGGTYRTTTDDAVYTPFGGGALNDLVAVVSDNDGSPMTELEQAALSPGDAFSGETAGVSLTNLFKLVTNQRHRLITDPAHLNIYGTVARGGKSADELRPNHTQGSVEYYARFTSLMGQLKTEIVVGDSDSLQVILITRIQGETDTVGGGLSDNAADYEAVIKIDHDAKLAWVAANLPDQSLPPIHLYVIPGGGYARNFDPDGNFEQFVPMAIQRFCRKTVGCFVVGPYYPYTSNSNNHRDVNGYRWLGVKEALIADEIINGGKAWEPFWPIRVRTVGAVSEIDFHVPEPPIILGTPYQAYNALDETDLPTWGFQAYDLFGGLTITPQLVSDTIVRLTYNRTPVGPGAIVYGGENYNGMGLMCDSCITDPRLDYEFNLGSGDDDVAPLIGNRYPMNNWLVPFTLPFNWSAL